MGSANWGLDYGVACPSLALALLVCFVRFDRFARLRAPTGQRARASSKIDRCYACHYVRQEKKHENDTPLHSTYIHGVAMLG